MGLEFIILEFAVGRLSVCGFGLFLIRSCRLGIAG